MFRYILEQKLTFRALFNIVRCWFGLFVHLFRDLFQLLLGNPLEHRRCARRAALVAIDIRLEFGKLKDIDFLESFRKAILYRIFYFKETWFSGKLKEKTYVSIFGHKY